MRYTYRGLDGPQNALEGHLCLPPGNMIVDDHLDVSGRREGGTSCIVPWGLGLEGVGKGEGEGRGTKFP